MQLVSRRLAKDIREDLRYFPAVGIVGPRQVGKTTLAQQLADGRPVRWFDAQRPGDAQQLREAGLVLPDLADRLVVIDEVQLLPELFGRLRPIIDADRRPGRFLLLGSASPDLIRGASESLAGRIAYAELAPLSLPEVTAEGILMRDHLVAGGFPEPLLRLPAKRRERWFRAFITTYVTRDLAELGREVIRGDFERLLSMLAHQHGGLLNASALARSLTVTNDTVRRYIDLLERSFLVRRLPPWLPNVSKRLVKSPRVFFRDSGLRHHLLAVRDYATLLGHPGLGASWEGYVIEEIARVVGEAAAPHFYRTAKGAELDLVMDFRDRRLAFECKFSEAPTLTKGFFAAVADVQPERTYVVTPGTERYEWAERVVVIGLETLLEELAGGVG